MQRVLYILLNLFAFPGLGTFSSGRKKRGCCQLLMGLFGFMLTLLGSVIIFYFAIMGDGFFLLARAIEEENFHLLQQVLIALLISIAGFVLFLTSWIWAALTPQNPLPPPLPTR
jgi:polyferredoxin